MSQWLQDIIVRDKRAGDLHQMEVAVPEQWEHAYMDRRELLKHIDTFRWRTIGESRPEQGQQVLMFSAYASGSGFRFGYYDCGIWIGPNGGLGGITHWKPVAPPDAPSNTPIADGEKQV